MPAAELLAAGTATLAIRLDRNYVSPSGQAPAREMEHRQALIDVVPRQRIIERPRLTRLLDESSARILLLVAPAGYGKTTLARQWLATRRHAWYRGSSASADVAALALGLSDAVQTVVPGAGQRMGERLRATGTPEEDAEVLAEMLAEDLASWPEDACLVIDDYHLASVSNYSDRFLNVLVSVAPIRVLLITRTRPAWASTRRLLYGEISELDRTVLAMTPDEALEALGEDRTAQMSGLVALAEGWPAVIGLAALTEGRDLPRVLPANLHDYFAEELYKAVPADVQHGLMQLSLLSTVTTHVARDLLGAAATEMLRAGVKCGFLTSSERGTYEWHPLLRSFVEAKLKEEAETQIAAVASGVGKALLEHGRWDDAFDLVQRAFSKDVFLEMVELALPSVMEDARLPTVDRWVEEARERGLDSPALSLADAELNFRRGERKRAEALALHATKRLPPTSPLRVRAYLVAGSAAHLEGDEMAALEYYGEASRIASTDAQRWDVLRGQLLSSIVLELDDTHSELERLQALADGTPDREVSLVSVQYSFHSRLASAHGQADVLAAATHLLERVRDPVKGASLLYAHAQALITEGRYSEGLKAVRRTSLYVKEARVSFALPYITLTSALGELGLRSFSAAARLIARATRTALEGGTPYLIVQALLAQTRLYLTQGLFSRASEALDEVREQPMAPGEYGEYLAYRALTLANLGDLTNACALAREARERTHSPEVGSLVPCVNAITAVRADATDAAFTCLSAFLATREFGHVDAYVTAYRTLPDILAPVADRDELRAPLTLILGRARDDQIATRLGLQYKRQGKRRGATLSSREREVLVLVAQGLTNREVARALYIQESTAKLHMRHILEKLEANRRTEAVMKARALGLID